MEDALIEQSRQPELRRLPWHKPQLERLVVRLDTKAETKGGSAADGPSAFDLFVGPVVD